MSPFTGRKGALAFVSILLMLSMGGGFLALPLLVPAHVWAARRSAPVGCVLWSTFPVITAGMVTWALTYLAVGEAQPLIWLLPVVACVGAGLGMVHFARPPRKHIPLPV